MQNCLGLVEIGSFVKIYDPRKDEIEMNWHCDKRHKRHILVLNDVCCVMRFVGFDVCSLVMFFGICIMVVEL